MARSIHELLKSKVSVLNMRRSLKALQRLLPQGEPHALRNKCIVINRGRPYLEEANRPAVDLIEGQMVFAFMLDADDLWERSNRMFDARRKAQLRRLERAERIKRENHG